MNRDTPRAETRLSAAEAGRSRYLGRPCKQCGAKVRYTANAGCVACQKARGASYMSKVLESLREAKAAREE